VHSCFLKEKEHKLLQYPGKLFLSEGGVGERRLDCHYDSAVRKPCQAVGCIRLQIPSREKEALVQL